MPEHNERPKAVRINLTDAQKERVFEALGQARVAAGDMAIELTVDELEQRITPRIMGN